jgi:hypothetical protein
MMPGESLAEWEERVGLEQLRKDIETHARYGVSGLSNEDVGWMARLVMISVRDYWPKDKRSGHDVR